MFSLKKCVNAVVGFPGCVVIAQPVEGLRLFRSLRLILSQIAHHLTPGHFAKSPLLRQLSVNPLAEPAGEISITMKDGTTEVFHIGNTNSTAGAVYLYKDDDTSTVYLVSTDILSAYNNDLSSLEGSKGITEQSDEGSSEE